MLIRSLHRPWLLMLLLLAVVLTRLGGAHMHLCFDGSEPPASLHFSGNDHHDDHHADQAHEDVDVSVVVDAAAKLGKLSLELSLIIAVFCGFALLLRPLLRVPLPAGDLNPLPVRAYLRPPLRGPPR